MCPVAIMSQGYKWLQSPNCLRVAGVSCWVIVWLALWDSAAVVSFFHHVLFLMLLRAERGTRLYGNMQDLL